MRPAIARPAALKAFDALYLGAVAVSALDTALNYDELKAAMQETLAASGAQQFGDTALIGGLVVGFVISLSLWFLVSVLRVEFVKWLIAAIAVWGAIAFVRAVMEGGYDTAMLGGMVVVAMNLLAAALLFAPTVKAWFLASRNPPDTM